MKAKKIAKTVSLLWVGALFGSGSTFLIYMILARKLGPENFGIFSSVISTVTILTLIAGFGVSQFWLKVFGKEGWQGVRWLKSSFKFITLTLGLVSIILFSWAIFGPHDESTQQLLFIMVFYIYSQVVIELVSAKLQLEERYIHMAFWQLLPNLTRLIVISIYSYMIFTTINTIDIALVYAIVGISTIIIGLYQLNKMSKGIFYLKGHIGKGENISCIPTLKNMFPNIWPFGLAAIFSFIYLQSDIILVKYLVGSEEAGYYNVGFVVLSAVLIFPSVFYQKFLMPQVHRWANNNRNKFYHIYKKGNIIMLLSGIMVMLLVWLTSRTIIPLLFGKQYFTSIFLTNILALTIPITFTSYSIGTTLVTSEHMKKKVVLMGIIAIVNVLLNIVLIPKYNALGAAIATVISNLMLLILYYFFAQKIVFSNEMINFKR